MSMVKNSIAETVERWSGKQVILSIVHAIGFRLPGYGSSQTGTVAVNLGKAGAEGAKRPERATE